MSEEPRATSLESGGFWSIVCRYAPYFYLLLLIVTVLFVLNVFALVLGEQSGEAYVITVVNFFVLGGTWAGVALLLWHCQRP